MTPETPRSAQEARRAEIEQAIDRSLDDAGRFLRYHWLLIVGVVVALVALWYIATHLRAALIFIVQVAFVVGFILAVGAALLWLLERPRLHTLLPRDADISLNEFEGAPEALEMARGMVALLRGARVWGAEQSEIRRGALLIGPAGVGKRFLATCISAEAETPLLSVSASSYRTMIPGLDAFRLRSLYRRARGLAREFGACVVYLDDLDAMSVRSRDALLAQLAPSSTHARWWRRGNPAPASVLTIGATTTLDALDPALLRSGRFHRRVILSAPDDARRAVVIQRFLNAEPHDESIPLARLVTDLCGYTPGAIQRTLAEAVVIAHGAGRESVTYDDILAACGGDSAARAPRTLAPLEKRRLAYHEAGHAVAQAYLTPRLPVTHLTVRRWPDPLVDVVSSSTIITRSAEEVRASIQVALAGRVSEEVFVHARLDRSGGDLAHATELALGYESWWGMGASAFADATMTPGRLAAEPALRERIERLLRQTYADTRALLERRRLAVVAIAEALVEREDLGGAEIAALLRQAEAPMPAEMAALTSVAENALFGTPAAEELQEPAPYVIGPVAAAGATPRSPRPSGPNAFAASPSQELRADRVIDRALLHAPLRQSLTTDLDPPAVPNGSNRASGD